MKYHKLSKKAKGTLKTERPMALHTLQVAHESDGDIAAPDIIEILPDLPQDLKDEEHGLGAKRRNKWLKQKDFDAYLDDIKKKGMHNAYRRRQFKTISLSKSNRQKYLNELAKQQGLSSNNNEWKIVNKKNEKTIKKSKDKKYKKNTKKI